MTTTMTTTMSTPELLPQTSPSVTAEGPDRMVGPFYMRPSQFFFTR